MSIQNKYEELIESSYKELEFLKSEVTQIKDIRKNIELLIGSNNELPKIFEEKFIKIIKLSEDYSNTLGAATKNYLDGNNSLFTIKLNELSTKIKEFEKETTRLINTDFTKLFKDLQKVLIDQTREDLAKELKRFEEKSKDLQTKIDELNKQIERLELIDLEKHFDRLQKTLSEIFGAINGINLTLTATTQTLNSIVQSLGGVQNSIDGNHKETKQVINTFSETTSKNFTSQINDAKKNTELLANKMKTISDQNEIIRKEMRSNRIFQFVNIGLSLLVLIYLIMKYSKFK